MTETGLGMRVALLPSAYHPSVGGVEELSRKLAAELARRGHAVEVWTSRSPGDAWPTLDRVDDIVVRRFTFPAPRLAPGALASWPKRARPEFTALRRAVHEFRPDLLHVQCFSTNGVYASALSALMKIPLVVTLQGETVMDDQDIYQKSVFLRTALRLGVRRASAVTGCSRFTLDDAVSRFGCPPGKSRVIFNGVDLEEPGEEPFDQPFPAFVAAIGRMVDKKGFDLLLDAWSVVVDRFPDVGLIIGGSGPADVRLRELIEARRIPRVHLPGRLDRPQVAWLMNHARLVVMPSRVEPFGIVALEAWRAGQPVVVTSRGGAAEFVVDKVSGRVVDPFDREALGLAIAELLEDRPAAERMGQAGRSAVARFAWPRITDDYERVYRSVT